MRIPRELGPVPLVGSPQRVKGAATRRREGLCVCPACVAAMPWREGVRQRRQAEMRRKLYKQLIGG